MTKDLKVKLIGAALALTSLGSWTAQAEGVRSVAPALEKYTQDRLLGEVWKRPGLSQRDRSIVTLATIVARNHTAEMPYYLNLALDNGVKPAEISELITHLAFYSGWGNAMSAVEVSREVFAKRGVRADQLPSPSPKPLPLDEAGRPTARSESASSSVPYRPESCSTPPTPSSATSGCVPTSRRVTAAW